MQIIVLALEFISLKDVLNFFSKSIRTGKNHTLNWFWICWKRKNRNRFLSFNKKLKWTSVTDSIYKFICKKWKKKSNFFPRMFENYWLEGKLCQRYSSEDLYINAGVLTSTSWKNKIYWLVFWDVLIRTCTVYISFHSTMLPSSVIQPLNYNEAGGLICVLLISFVQKDTLWQS